MGQFCCMTWVDSECYFSADPVRKSKIEVSTTLTILSLYPLYTSTEQYSFFQTGTISKSCLKKEHG